MNASIFILQASGSIHRNSAFHFLVHVIDIFQFVSFMHTIMHFDFWIYENTVVFFIQTHCDMLLRIYCDASKRVRLLVPPLHIPNVLCNKG